MYFANMYCYGWDYDCVGITPIVTCMGVVYKGSRAMYAIHIPDNTAQYNSLGGQTFAQFVQNGEHSNGKGGELLVFVNGGYRQTAQQEARDIWSLLSKPLGTLIRFQQGLPQPPNHAAAILVRNDHGYLVKRYAHIPDNQWTADGAKPESGQYRAFDAFKGATRPIQIQGWSNVNNTNCAIMNIG
jgi:hypothetical protein